MSMLAERKSTPKWVLNPVASDWSKDQNKLGQKMLEKMGWSAGKGLGAKEQGRLEAIRISYKGDTRGLGAGRRKEQEDWLQQQQSFQALLEGLNGDTDKSVKINSLEEKSKTTRTKIHYHKFARGKDISRYSEKDLSCIVGSGFVPFKVPEAAESVSTPSADAPDDDASKNLDTGDLSGEESMNRGRSRSGRVLKPSAKLAEASPTRKTTAKHEKTLEPILPAQPEDGMVPRRRKREAKGSATALECVADGSLSPNKKDRSPSPQKKKKKKKESAEIENNSPSKPGPSKVPIIHPVADHLHSRSGREYKPSARAKDNMEERSPSPSKRKSPRISNEPENDTKNIHARAEILKAKKKQKTRKDSTGEESGSVSHPKLPKTKSKKVTNDVVEEDVDDSGISEPLKEKKKKRKGKGASEQSADDASTSEMANPRKRAKTNKTSSAEVEVHKEYAKQKKIPKEPKSAMEPKSSTSRTSRREKSRRSGVMENGATGDSKGSDLTRKEPKGKKRGKSSESNEISQQTPADESEEPTQVLKKVKKKGGKSAATTEEAVENNEGTELPSKIKRKKKRNIDKPEQPAEDDDENAKVRKPIVKHDRVDSSESQETVASKRPDGEDATEELSSINSQSSLIYDMIGNVSPLKVGDQPRELTKYAILLSDSGSDD